MDNQWQMENGKWKLFSVGKEQFEGQKKSSKKNKEKRMGKIVDAKEKKAYTKNTQEESMSFAFKKVRSKGKTKKKEKKKKQNENWELKIKNLYLL